MPAAATAISAASLLLLLTVAMPAPSSALARPSSDLAVIGVGVLGTSLCKQILSSDDFRSRVLTGITKSDARHGAIRAELFGSGGSTDDDGGDAAGRERFIAATLEDALADAAARSAGGEEVLQEDGGGTGGKFRDVVFCAPPSGFDDYPSAVRQAALHLWSGPEGGGSFVFTSSGGVYEGLDGETVDESSPTVDPESNPRQGRIVGAEREAVGAGGCALRLAGLYALDRGAHNYWLEKCRESGVAGRADSLVNLLNYDDSASACLAALRAGRDVNAGRTFLISDGRPITRKGICESALKHPRYAGEGYGIPKFNGPEDGPLGKVYDGSQSNAALGWRPKHESFDAFMSGRE